MSNGLISFFVSLLILFIALMNTILDATIPLSIKILIVAIVFIGSLMIIKIMNMSNLTNSEIKLKTRTALDESPLKKNMAL